MIDFSVLNVIAGRKLTIEEKFIVQNLLDLQPVRQKDIAANLVISRYGVQKCTERLIDDGLLTSYENEFGITLFTATELTLTSIGLTSTSTPLTSKSTELTSTATELTTKSTQLTATSTELTPPSPRIRSKPIVNLTLTEPKGFGTRPSFCAFTHFAYV
jgi:biotin operon repressor